MAQSELTVLSDVMLGSIVGVLALIFFGLLNLPPASARQIIRQNRQTRARHAPLHAMWRAIAAEFPHGLPRIPVAPAGQPDPHSMVPPVYLFHGTARAKLVSILRNGLEGRTGGWAFAAPDIATAEGYALAHEDGIVLRIHSQRAYQNGTYFEHRGPYYVARAIHPAFVDFAWSLTRHAQLQ